MKKLAILVMAVGALAISLPASAAANEMFYDNENPIGESGVTVSYSGNMKTVVAGGGIECNKVATTFSFGTVRGIYVTAATFEECATFGTLAAAGCKLEGNPTGESFPWQISFTPTLRLTNLKISFKIAPGCGIPGFGGGGTIVWSASETGPTFMGEEIGENLFSADTLELGGTINTTLGPAELSGTLTSNSPGTITFEE